MASKKKSDPKKGQKKPVLSDEDRRRQSLAGCSDCPLITKDSHGNPEIRFIETGKNLCRNYAVRLRCTAVQGGKEWHKPRNKAGNVYNDCLHVKRAIKRNMANTPQQMFAELPSVADKKQQT